MSKGLDDFPPAARTVIELALNARRLVSEAMGACNALNEALTDEQRYACERVIGAAHDSLSSAAANLEYVTGRLAATSR